MIIIETIERAQYSLGMNGWVCGTDLAIVINAFFFKKSGEILIAELSALQAVFVVHLEIEHVGIGISQALRHGAVVLEIAGPFVGRCKRSVTNGEALVQFRSAFITIDGGSAIEVGDARVTTKPCIQ